MLAEPFGGLLFSFTSYFSDHDDSLGLWVVDELREHVNEVCSIEWIAADANNGRLTKVKLSGLVDCLVSQSTRSGHDTYFTFLMDVTRHDSDLAFSWLDDARAIWTDQARLRLRFHD